MVNKNDLLRHMRYTRIAYLDQTDKFYPGGLLNTVHKNYFTYIEENDDICKVVYYEDVSLIWGSIYAEVAIYINQQKPGFDFKIKKIKKIKMNENEFRIYLDVYKCFFCCHDSRELDVILTLSSSGLEVSFKKSADRIDKSITIEGSNPYNEVYNKYQKTLNDAVTRLLKYEAQQSNTGPTLFPVEIWMRILLHLDVKDLVSFGATSRYFYHLIRKTEWINRVEIRNAKSIEIMATRYQFTNYRIFCSNITDDFMFLLKKCKSLSLERCRNITHIGIGMLECCETLSLTENLRIKFDYIENTNTYDRLKLDSKYDKLYKYSILNNCQNLDLYNIRCKSLTDEDLATLNYCQTFKLTCGRISCESITNDGIKHLLKTAQLRDLTLHNFKCLRDDTLELMSKYQSIDLSECRKITDVGVQILHNCSVLRLAGCELITDDSVRLFGNCHILDISRCPLVTNASVKMLVNCRELNLSGCPLITDQSVIHLAQIGHCYKMDLSDCPQITDECVKYLAPCCRELSLRRCKKITDLSAKYIATAGLCEVLHLDECKITDQGLIYLKIIRELSLQKCTDITDKGVRALRCEKLILNGCSQLTDSALEFMGNCHTLEIKHCDKITDKGLEYLTECRILYINRCTLITDNGVRRLQKCYYLHALRCKKITKACVHEFNKVGHMKWKRWRLKAINGVIGWDSDEFAD